MKNQHVVPLLSVVLGVAALSAGGCAPKKDPGASTSMPSAQNSAPAVVATDGPAPKASSAVAAAFGTAAATVNWADLDALTFERREEFIAGTRQMEVAVDRQLAELTAKRAAMKGTVATKDWDFAMKEMNDARTYLKSMGEEAAKSTADTWAQQKAKVGQAWVRAQAAHDKVRSSTTS